MKDLRYILSAVAICIATALCLKCSHNNCESTTVSVQEPDRIAPSHPEVTLCPVYETLARTFDDEVILRAIIMIGHTLCEDIEPVIDSVAGTDDRTTSVFNTATILSTNPGVNNRLIALAGCDKAAQDKLWAWCEAFRIFNTIISCTQTQSIEEIVDIMFRVKRIQAHFESRYYPGVMGESLSSCDLYMFPFTIASMLCELSRKDRYSIYQETFKVLVAASDN